MPEAKKEQLIRIVRHTDLSRDIMAFVVDRQARGLSPRTVEFYGDELRFWQGYVEGRGVQSVQDITADLLRHYLLHLGKRRNAGGVHAAYRAIRAFLNWYEAECEPHDWRNPIHKVRPPRLSQEPLCAVDLQDLKAMLTTCERRTFIGERDRAILLCLLDSGARASEFVALDVADVNLSSGAVLIRRGKGRKWRTAFLGTRSRRQLVRYLRHRGDGGPLWLTDEGKRLTYSGVRQIVRRRAIKAGMPVPSLHSFRRAFALTCLRAGMNVYALQKLMGHSDLSVLRRYLAQTEGDLRKAHEQAGPVDNML